MILALAVGGCGTASGRRSSTITSSAASSSATASSGAAAALPATCPRAAQAAVARAFGPRVVARIRESGQATPECVLRAGRARVTVLVDGFAQPYQRLERTAIEDAQQFGARRLEALPQTIGGVGIDAYWFPTERQFMTTEGRRLITVFVVARGLSERRQRAVARAVAERYLGPNDLRAADPGGS